MSCIEDTKALLKGTEYIDDIYLYNIQPPSHIGFKINNFMFFGIFFSWHSAHSLKLTFNSAHDTRYKRPVSLSDCSLQLA